jgi:hypothetical protein
MKLTPEQKQAIRSGRPVRVGVGGAECILLRKDVYEQAESLDFSPVDPRGNGLAGAEPPICWPAMDSMNRGQAYRKEWTELGAAVVSVAQLFRETVALTDGLYQDTSSYRSSPHRTRAHQKSAVPAVDLSPLFV